MPRAVIYTRVSSEEQVSNLSLDVQEQACRAYCAREGLEVERVYREEGESARTADRTELRRMLADLRAARSRIEYVIVYDTSRFARDLYVHASLKQLLLKSGARLRAATQPLDDSAAGRAIEGVLAVFNQFDNEQRAEKVTAGMRETAARGHWPWLAPLGYLNGRTPEGGKAVLLDSDRAELVRCGFQLVAGGEPPAAVLRHLAALGLRGRAGRPLRYADWVKMLRNPFYAGRVRSAEWGIDTAGRHEALVDAGTWSRVQIRLAGKGRGKPYQHRHPDFPLRGFARCARCGSPLTASWSTGHTGVRYPYYRCWVKACGATRVRADRLEDQFSAALAGVQLSAGMLRLVEASLLDLWRGLQADGDRTATAARRRLTELKNRKQRLMEAYVYDRAIDRELYDRELATLDEAETMAQLELHDAALEELDLEGTLGFARHVLTDTSRLWKIANTEQRRRLQVLVCPSGITYGPEGLGTLETALIFRLLQPTAARDEELVEQKGFEPSTPTLRTWCSPS